MRFFALLRMTKSEGFAMTHGEGQLICVVHFTIETNRYEELWAKAQESLRTLQGLISYIEKSGV
jgi:hypothetical protein